MSDGFAAAREHVEYLASVLVASPAEDDVANVDRAAVWEQSPEGQKAVALKNRRLAEQNAAVFRPGTGWEA